MVRRAGPGAEAFTNYSKISHGEAIVYGMIVALKISQKLTGLSKDIKDNSISLLKKLCRTKIPNIPKTDFLNYLFRDKKVKSKQIHFILINDLGKPIIRNDIDPEIIYNSYNSLLKEEI